MYQNKVNSSLVFTCNCKMGYGKEFYAAYAFTIDKHAFVYCLLFSEFVIMMIMMMMMMMMMMTMMMMMMMMVIAVVVSSVILVSNFRNFDLSLSLSKFCRRGYRAFVNRLRNMPT